MELTTEQLQELRAYKSTMDDNNIRFKEIIKRTLIDDPLIIYLLNNKELEVENADPSDYLDVNILPYYMIHPTQHNVQNFICYEVQFKETPRYNDSLMYVDIIFYILCEEKNGTEKLTGIARHDLIAARIKHLFNWTNKFGTQCHVLSDLPSVTDNDYATRTITFEMVMGKDIVKTKDNVSRVVNRIGG